MAKLNLETVRGMRDFLPEEKIFRDEVIAKIKKVFERYGFAPLETPVLENLDVLKSKDSVGDEALKLVYDFTDKGGRPVALRYDLTVPLARVIAMNPQLPKPFKRYCIDKSWRYERPQAGRYREFYQCDVDIIGAESVMADAEILACAKSALEEAGLAKFSFRINSRKLMGELLESAGVARNQFVRTLRVLDKMDKNAPEEIAKELRTFLSEESTNELIELVKVKGDWYKISKTLKICDATRKEIEEFIGYLKNYGVKNYTIDLSLARGLDYYTGIVFEIDAGKEIGSIGGGGRYDDMIGKFSGQKVPATGLAIGLERVMTLLTSKRRKTNTKVYVVPIKEIERAIEIIEDLRRNGINADLDLSGRSVGKNLEYASKMEIPFVILVGEQEIKQGKVKLRDMQTGEELLLAVEEVAEKLK